MPNNLYKIPILKIGLFKLFLKASLTTVHLVISLYELLFKVSVFCMFMYCSIYGLFCKTGSGKSQILLFTIPRSETFVDSMHTTIDWPYHVYISCVASSTTDTTSFVITSRLIETPNNTIPLDLYGL